jgi:predicted nucleic acid-binding protein
MALVDTNILLRWLLADHPELTAKAETIINTAKPGTLVVTDIVAAEVVYVLRGRGYDRLQVSEAMQLITRTPQLIYENPAIILHTVDHFATTGLDFADCYLLSRHELEQIELHTLDNKLYKMSR